jgi:hypothetical protein
MEQGSNSAPRRASQNTVHPDNGTIRSQPSSPEQGLKPALEGIRSGGNQDTTATTPDITYDPVRSEGSPTAGDNPGQKTRSQPEDKGKAPDMSYPGDYYYQSRMGSNAYSGKTSTSSSNNQRLDTSRTTTGSSSSGSSSSASTPRQGTEGSNTYKKDDKSGGGGGSGVGSGASGGSGSRSRLVAGVFVRY